PSSSPPAPGTGPCCWQPRTVGFMNATVWVGHACSTAPRTLPTPVESVIRQRTIQSRAPQQRTPARSTAPSTTDSAAAPETDAAGQPWGMRRAARQAWHDTVGLALPDECVGCGVWDVAVCDDCAAFLGGGLLRSEREAPMLALPNGPL